VEIGVGEMVDGRSWILDGEVEIIRGWGEIKNRTKPEIKAIGMRIK
jgi:hypothetical protein